MINLQKFKTLIDLLTYFQTERVCRDYLEIVRWEGALQCPYADCEHNKVFKFSSRISLQKWYAAIYLVTSHKKGISSLQLHRDIGVTQKTAWYMLHRVRHSFGIENNPEKLTGVVEADETFIGGKEANKHKSKRTEGTQGRSTETKTAVAGVLQRGTGKVIAKVVPNTGGQVLRRFVYENVAVKSELKTDEWYGYKGLHKLYEHSICNHSTGEYLTNNDTHTNTLEGYWSLVKRGCIGIYHSWSDKHLQKYLDEFSFRYFTRNLTESDRFNAMLSNIAATLPYKHLIADARKEQPIFRPTTPDNGVEAKQGSLGL